MSFPAKVSFFLEKAGVSSRRRALAGEMIASIENLAHISEEDLLGMEWPNKNGEFKDILKQKDVQRVFSLLAKITGGVQEPTSALRSYIDIESNVIELTKTLSTFDKSDAASRFARRIKKFSALVTKDMGEIKEVSEQAGFTPKATQALLNVKRAIESDFYEIDDRIQAFRQYASSNEMLSCGFRSAFCAQRALGEEDFSAAQKQELARLLSQETWSFNPDIGVLLTLAEQALGETIERTDRVVKLAKRLSFMLDPRISWKFRRALFEIWQNVEKVYFDKVPRFTAEAIETVNPFLVRPLFRSFAAAKVYAAGGKIASSLETIWGTTLENLFIIMGDEARGVGNGGIDVVVGRDGFDVKSGPAVMNNDQINVLEIKQRIVQQDNYVPSLDTFRVALAYGREDQAFGTMSSHVESRDILPAREAWMHVTGDELSPEKVYGLCGLIADIVGVPDVIEASAEGDPSSDEIQVRVKWSESKFEELLKDSFDSPVHGETDPELDALKELRGEVQGLA